jgi:hypothetical protein
VLERSLVTDVSGVQRGSGLEQKDVGFLLSDRSVLDASRHDDELTLFDPDVPIPELHAKAAFDHQKQLILVIVMMPDELASELDQLYQLAIQLACDFWAPVVGETRELVP